MSTEKQPVYAISSLAVRFGLSRSTLLYYDRIGLLSPRGHSAGEYRSYSAADAAKLDKICMYRRAGLPLKRIKFLLEAGGNQLTETLELRLGEIDDELAALREQQALVLKLMNSERVLEVERVMTKETWVELLRISGFSDEGMTQWHVNFKRRSPAKHLRFLRALGIPAADIEAIRAL